MKNYQVKKICTSTDVCVLKCFKLFDHKGAITMYPVFHKLSSSNNVKYSKMWLIV